MIRKFISFLLITILALSNLAMINSETCVKESDYPHCLNDNVYDGYWWHNYWIPGIPTQETQMLMNPPIVRGVAVFYSPNVMEATAKAKELKIEEPYLDGVSLLTCGDIGKSVWIKRPKHPWEGPFLVIDCAKRGDLFGVINHKKEVVEVGFKTAQRWGMVILDGYYSKNYSVIVWGFRDVLVSKYPPEYTRDFDILDMDNWFNSVLVFSTNNIDRNTCPLRYRPPKTKYDLPHWRINCEWKKLYNKSITGHKNKSHVEFK